MKLENIFYNSAEKIEEQATGKVIRRVSNGHELNQGWLAGEMAEMLLIGSNAVKKILKQYGNDAYGILKLEQEIRELDKANSGKVGSKNIYFDNTSIEGVRNNISNNLYEMFSQGVKKQIEISKTLGKEVSIPCYS